jgi:tellurium resistance protein TerD
MTTIFCRYQRRLFIGENMAINLQKGQRVAVGLQNFTVGLGWDPADTGQEFDLDVTACMVGDSKKVPAENFFVFYNNLQSPDGAVKSTGDNRTGAGDGDDEQMLVDTGKVSPSVTAIVFSASIHEAAQRKQNFGQIQNSYIRIFNPATQEEICRYELCEDFSIETAVEFGRLYTKDGAWKFEATGIGHKDGLEGIVAKYC